ncbi:hypothetical protein LL033_21910 [Clostridium estertheticum]|uniref:hypothetical protein n=1 Tax=Clostridium estertheticum TaxID=238834 RepID=UPI001C0B7553|nr:hypothetical protein [Clostridium estertheticum]MBU3217537.1 hypothetical protein [Clostridium estertheticum]WAG55231.1 hypothetical protein LL033_21910 [Clostridium estertheticum]
MSLMIEIQMSKAMSKAVFSTTYERKNLYIIILIVLSTISVVYLSLKGPSINLDENQILYIYIQQALK